MALRPAATCMPQATIPPPLRGHTHMYGNATTLGELRSNRTMMVLRSGFHTSRSLASVGASGMSLYVSTRTRQPVSLQAASEVGLTFCCCESGMAYDSRAAVMNRKWLGAHALLL
eukprot:365199-Chlamydomonas_euryale.AAC.5